MSETSSIQTSRLFIFDPNYGATVSDIYIGRAKAPQRRHQQLIIIVEMPRGKDGQSQMMDTIVQAADKAFQHAKVVAPELVLEHTLEALNFLLPDIVPRGGRDWLSKLNILVAISEHGQIHFSSLGSINSILIQKNRVTSLKDDSEELNPLKLFSNITSGVLNPGDGLLFTNPSLIDYVSEPKIKNITLQMSAERATRELETLLSDVPSHVTFCAVIVKFVSPYGEAAYGAPSETKSRAQSVQQSDLPEFEAAASTPAAARRIKPRYIRGSLTRRIFLWLWDNFVYYVKAVSTVITTLATIISRSLQALINASKRRALEEQLLSATKSFVNTQLERWRERTMLQKIIILFVVVAVFVYVHTLIFQSQGQQIVKKVDTYNEALVTVSELKSEVDSAILYEDERRAETILIQIDKTLKSISPQTKEQRDQIDGFIEENNIALNNIRHINYISTPLVFADLNTITEPLSDFIVRDGDILTLTDSQIYRVFEGQIEQLILTENKQASLLYNASENDSFYLAPDDIYRINETNLQALNLDISSTITNLQAAELYADNLYLFDNDSKIIYKYANAGQSFRSAAVWYDDGQVLTKISDFAIDGSVYLITNDGLIIKLFRGEREPFEYHRPNPVIGSQSKIVTSSESEFLFILDPENNRVVILDKDGNIKDQFTSSKFDNLISLAVDEEEETIYLLNGHTIYLLAIND